MQFTLRDLLLCFVSAAIGLRAGIVTGFSFVFWKWVVWSAILSALFVFLASSRRRRAFVPGVVLAALFLLGVSSSITPTGPGFVATLLFAAATIVVLVWNITRVGILVRVSLAIITVTCAFAQIASLEAVRHMHALRRLHPEVPIGPRLAYEQTSAIKHRSRLAEILPHSELRTGLDWHFVRYDNARRTGALMSLWDEDEFASASLEGFLLSDNYRRLAEELSVPPLVDIAFSRSGAPERLNAADFWQSCFRDRPPGLTPWETLHWISVTDFLDDSGYGVVGRPQPGFARGFIEHAFHYHPLAVAGKKSPPAEYELVRLELISLLKFDEPRVYVLDHLPRMDQLRLPTATTRPLDEFESEAIEQLLAKTDLAVRIDSETKTVRIVGVIRAMSRCTHCHQVPYDTAIGAFSYELRR